MGCSKKERGKVYTDVVVGEEEGWQGLWHKAISVVCGLSLHAWMEKFECSCDNSKKKRWKFFLMSVRSTLVFRHKILSGEDEILIFQTNFAHPACKICLEVLAHGRQSYFPQGSAVPAEGSDAFGAAKARSSLCRGTESRVEHVRRCSSKAFVDDERHPRSTPASLFQPCPSRFLGREAM